MKKIETVNLNEYIGKTFYCIPAEFKDNCKQGVPTKIWELTLTKTEEPNYAKHIWAKTYVFEDQFGRGIKIIEAMAPAYLNAKIGTTYSCGLYFTMEDAKKAVNAYIANELAKAERQIQTGQERKNKLNNCLI